MRDIEMSKKVIKDMFIEQYKLNVTTCGENWINGVVVFDNVNNPIDWDLCIIMECCEAIDNLPWKHWKVLGGDLDYDNLLIEIIDIWHFIMSSIIARLVDSKDITDSKYLSNTKSLSFTIDQIAMIMEDLDISYTPGNKDIAVGLDTNEIIIRLKHVIEIVVCDRGHNLYNLLTAFFSLLKEVNISISELYGRYLTKNVLNKFRQEHGYKEGTYIKMINGV